MHVEVSLYVCYAFTNQRIIMTFCVHVRGTEKDKGYFLSLLVIYRASKVSEASLQQLTKLALRVTNRYIDICININCLMANIVFNKQP